jgi:hypothetical protein
MKMDDVTVRLPASYYQQFDADHTLEVPGDGYGGWSKAEVEISAAHTAVVVMHAWDTGKPGEFPGWSRAVEYIPRANRIAATVFPRLLGAVRRSPLTLYHVVGGGSYYRHLPGYRRAAQMAGPPLPAPPQVEPDPVLDTLRDFRRRKVYPGERNEPDVKRGFARLDFMPQARPAGDEGVAESSEQLFALCRSDGINHLIYAGFAIDWCLLLSPGGMAAMQRHGLLCSALRQAVTAVENKETARDELAREIGLWRVAVAFGFVFDVEDFLVALKVLG